MKIIKNLIGLVTLGILAMVFYVIYSFLNIFDFDIRLVLNNKPWHFGEAVVDGNSTIHKPLEITIDEDCNELGNCNKPFTYDSQGNIIYLAK